VILWQGGINRPSLADDGAMSPFGGGMVICPGTGPRFAATGFQPWMTSLWALQVSGCRWPQARTAVVKAPTCRVLLDRHGQGADGEWKALSPRRYRPHGQYCRRPTCCNSRHDVRREVPSAQACRRALSRPHHIDRHRTPVRPAAPEPHHPWFRAEAAGHDLRSHWNQAPADQARSSLD
jgi:hypothetical protein